MKRLFVALAENEIANVWAVYISTKDIYTKAWWIRKLLRNDRRRDTYVMWGERKEREREREMEGTKEGVWYIQPTYHGCIYIYEETTSPYGPSDNPYHLVCMSGTEDHLCGIHPSAFRQGFSTWDRQKIKGCGSVQPMILSQAIFRVELFFECWDIAYPWPDTRDSTGREEWLT